MAQWLRRKELFYLTTHSTHFIYDYIASDIWQRTTQIAREETRSRHLGYSFRLAARVLLYASSYRQDDTYHGLCYTTRGTLGGTRNSSMGPPWRIDPMTHRTMSERSYHGATFRSCAVAMSIGYFKYRLQYRAGFKVPMGRCMATTPSSFSLTSNRVTTNYQPSVLDRQPSW